MADSPRLSPPRDTPPTNPPPMSSTPSLPPPPPLFTSTHDRSSSSPSLPPPPFTFTHDRSSSTFSFPPPPLASSSSTPSFPPPLPPFSDELSGSSSATQSPPLSPPNAVVRTVTLTSVGIATMTAESTPAVTPEPSPERSPQPTPSNPATATIVACLPYIIPKRRLAWAEFRAAEEYERGKKETYDQHLEAMTADLTLFKQAARYCNVVEVSNIEEFQFAHSHLLIDIPLCLKSTFLPFFIPIARGIVAGSGRRVLGMGG